MRRVSRTVQIPIETPDDATVRELRAVAREAALYGNGIMLGYAVARLGRLPKEMRTQLRSVFYTDHNDTLSSAVRDAMVTQCEAIWKRQGKDIMAGRARAAQFSESGALAVRADRSKRGVRFERDGDAFVLLCRLRPDAPPLKLTVALETTRAAKDRYIREALEQLWSGAWEPGTVRIRIRPHRAKIDTLISYSKYVASPSEGGLGATLGPYNPETNELPLRFDNGAPMRDFAHRVHHMLHIRRHHDGIRDRLRRRMGRAKGRRRAYLKRLREIGSFTTWAHGRMHELSREIVRACIAEHVGVLRIDALGEGDLPWHALRQMLAYKCEDAGIRIEQPDPRQDATYRAHRAEIAKATRRLRRARRGAEEVLELAASERFVVAAG